MPTRRTLRNRGGAKSQESSESTPARFDSPPKVTRKSRRSTRSSKAVEEPVEEPVVEQVEEPVVEETVEADTGNDSMDEAPEEVVESEMSEEENNDQNSKQLTPQKRKTEDDDDDEEDDDEEDVEEEEEEVDEQDEIVDDSNNEEKVVEARKSTPVKPSTPQTKATPSNKAETPKSTEENEEEEKSNEKNQESEEEENVAPQYLLNSSPPLSPTTSPVLAPRAETPKPTGPVTRLTIKEMLLENFKSYAGQQKIGPFHKCFSAVVGPNGSGKSNVIDALLFVFGRRSKQIRSKKVSQLIHCSDAFPDLDWAKVTVTFHEIIDNEDDPDAFTVVEGSEIRVSRTARKSNSSSYHLNDKPCQFKDIAALLKEKHVDLDNNRFLILQGEVEQISLMKPKGLTEHDDGLLEYLEDIIGTRRYVEPIKEAFNDVETVNDERNAQLHRVKHVEKELKALAGAKQEAVEFLAQNAALRGRQVLLNAMQRREARAASEKHRLDAENAINRLKEHEEEIKRIEEEQAAFEATYANEEKEYSEMATKLAETKKQYEEFMKQDAKAHEQLKHNSTQRSKLKKTQAKDSKVAQEKRNEAEQAETDITDKTEESEQVKKLLSEAESELEAIVASETTALNKELEEERAKLAELTTPLAEQRDEHRVATEEHRLLDDKLSAATRRFEAARDRLAELQSRMAELDGTLEEKRAQLEEAKARLPTIEQELGDADKHAKALEAEVMSSRSTLSEARASAGEVSSNSKVWAGLNKAKQQGLLPGIHGRLGELGAIDSKYDVAVSTACPALNHIVVDTTETAQKCVKLLRKYDLGVATFIVLERMKQSAKNAKQPKQFPEGSKRLFDLIRDVQPEHIGAFYHAMRDTLVAENVSEAQKWAHGSGRRHRVVTLDGVVIDASGAMSGGGRRVMRGAMGSQRVESSVTPAELKKMESQLEKLEKQFSAAIDARRVLDSDLADTTRLIEVLEVEVPRLEADQESLPTQIKEAEEQLPLLKAQCGAVDKKEVAELKRLTKVLEKLGKQLEKDEATAAKHESRIKELEKEILTAGSIRMAVQRSKVDELQAQLDQLQEGITRAKVVLKTSSAAAERATARLEKTDAALAELEQAAEEAATAYEQLQVDAAAVKKEHKQLTADLATLGDQLSSKRQRHAELGKALADGRSVRVDLVAAEKAAKKDFADEERRAKHWQKEMDKVSTEHAKAMRAVPEAVRDEVARCAWGDYADRALAGERPRDTADDEAAAPRDKRLVGVAEADGMRSAVASPSRSAPASTNDNDDDAMPVDDDNDDNDASSNVENHDDDDDASVEPLPFTELFVPADAELATLRKKDVLRQIAVCENTLSDMRPNMSAIERWQAKELEYTSRMTELEEVTAKRDAARQKYDALRKRRLDEFMAGFGVITMRLKEMYQMITLGGDAELELVDSLDPFSEGIVFSVRPPKKSWKNISNLSGGEKTLSSLALVFALHHYKPTPLYVMDEIDAALDFKNVSIVANYIKERTKNAQFIIISLRNYMFELADRLVGIYKTNDCTKSVCVNPQLFAQPPSTETENKETTSESLPSTPIANTKRVAASPLSPQTNKQ